MRIIDRYILKSVLSVFLSCLFMFLFLFIIIDTLSHLEDILKNKVQIEVLVHYYLYYLPAIFVQVAPFACLLSALYTFGKMNQGNEIIAMRASGLSIFQITKTVIAFGFIVSLTVFWLNDNLVPRSFSQAQKIKSEIEETGKQERKKKQGAIQNLSLYGRKNRLFFINRFYPSTNTMEGITILEQDESQDLTKKIVASKGIYKAGHWTFLQSITYNFDKEGQVLNEPQYLEEELMDIPETPAEFLNQGSRPDAMSIEQLKNYIARLSASGSSTTIRNLQVDLYQRFASSLTSIIIILLGIPFSLMMRRRSTGLSSIGISILVGFLYYVVDAISIALGKSGYIMPLLSAYLSHIIALFFSLALISGLP